MKKVSKFVLMLCFVLSAALSYAHSATRTENKKGEGITIEVKEKTCHGGLDKSNAIFASINGHVLTVFFSENLGQVTIEVTTATGTPMDCLSTQTPNGVNLFVPLAGDYIITFTLPNGDVYFGEFTVTD